MCFARVGKALERCLSLIKRSKDLVEQIISPVKFDTKLFIQKVKCFFFNQVFYCALLTIFFSRGNNFFITITKYILAFSNFLLQGKVLFRTRWQVTSLSRLLEHNVKSYNHLIFIIFHCRTAGAKVLLPLHSLTHKIHFFSFFFNDYNMAAGLREQAINVTQSWLGILQSLLLVKPTTVNFLLLADRILNFLCLELLADKAQFNFFCSLRVVVAQELLAPLLARALFFGLYCICIASAIIEGHSLQHARTSKRLNCGDSC